jgi:spoIIIJ-associated protein
LPRSIVKEAKTVEEALRIALEELGIEREDAEIEVINEGNKGLLGLIGNKNATVRVTEKLSIEEIVGDFLSPIFEKMDIQADIEVTFKDGQANIRLTGEDIGIIIGRRGETLDALQYLLSLVINRQSEDYIRVILDVADYRLKREETLRRLAKRVAEKVFKSRRNITLDAMNPYERRIIHSTLQDYQGVDTQSIGEEPNRKVVVRFKPGGYNK